MSNNPKQQDAFVSLQKNLDKVMDFYNQSPDIVFLKTTDSEFAECNQKLVEFSKLTKKSEILQHKDENLPWAENAHFYRHIDQRVLSGEVSRLVMPVKISTGEKRLAFQKKFRLCNSSNIAVAIVAIMQPILDKKLAISLQKLISSDVKLQIDSDYSEISYEVSGNYEGYNLSSRESQCLFYLLRGMTTKYIAKILEISSRTVEAHINNLKIKFECTRKNQVVAKALENNFLHIIPKGVSLIL